MWNSGTAKKLETWYASSQGAFALDQQHNLLQRLSFPMASAEIEPL